MGADFRGHPEWRALLATIIEFPQDDTVRLVAADWLTEHDEDEYAELIRLQVELEAGGLLVDGEYGGGSTPQEVRFRDLFHGGSGRLFPESTFGSKYAARFVFESDRVIPPAPFRSLVRRGFVAEVRCSAAAWCGRECGECLGRGEYEDGFQLSSRTCFACRGTGMTVGVGPRIVREQPVERVVLTDAEPMLIDTCGMGGVTGNVRWLRRPDYDGRSLIPDGVFYRLTGRRIGEFGVDYKDRKAATEDLSTAAIKWAKGATP